MSVRAAFLLGVLVLVSTEPGVAQSGGRLTGRVLGGDQGTPIAGAVVDVLESAPPRRAVTALDGRFLLQRLPAGTYTVRVRMIGYQPKVVTGIVVRSDQTTEQDLVLAAESVTLDEITVTAEAERGTVASALNEQRASVNVVNAITADEIARSPDGDAAAAIRRVSGVTVQDGRYVFVRGLGERYTTASLNGTRLPSPEPERKVVPLDLFPASLLEGITTAKTFTPDLPGDFSGANVDIKTREFPAERKLTLSVGSSVATRATGQTVQRGLRVGREWLAWSAGRRSLPSVFGGVDFRQGVSQDQVNALVGGFRNAWAPRTHTAQPGASFGVSMGGNDPVFGRPVGYLLAVSYAYDEEVLAQQRRANATPGSVAGTEREIDRYEGETGRTSVLWGGLFNLSSTFGSHSRLTFTTTFNRSGDSDARTEVGESENLGGRFQIQRQQYIERTTVSGQLRGEHQMGTRHNLAWSATAARVTRREPDRSEIVYQLDTDPQGNPLPPAWFSLSNEGAVRTFADLVERNVQGDLNYRVTLGAPERPHALKMGILARHTTRDADNQAFSISALLGRASRELSPEEIFDGRFSRPGDAFFRVTPLGQGGSYRASDDLYAGYGMVQLFLSDRVELVGGARVEHSKVEVTTQPTLGAEAVTDPSYTDVLPALALNISLTPNQVLRFAGSQTLSRPEYRELAPVQYREVLGGDNVLGNPDLNRTLIKNVDARWEWYPGAGEVISVGGFAKFFDQPIEQVFLGTSGTRIITYVNAESARNVGVEVEVRKNLSALASALRPWSFFANGTAMHSRVTVTGQGLAARLNDRRALVGQAPYVVNAGLTYASSSSGFSTSLLYNVVGRRIAGVGESPLPDVYEEARHAFDLSMRFPVLPGLHAKVDAKNLGDAATRLTQGSVTKSFVRSGRRFAVGFTWTPPRP